MPGLNGVIHDGSIPGNAVHPTMCAEWRARLEENLNRDEGVWFIRCKKSSRKPFVDVNDAVEEAICFGWIDKPAP